MLWNIIFLSELLIIVLINQIKTSDINIEWVIVIILFFYTMES